MKLSLEWGCPPSFVESRLSSRELVELMMYHRHFPFGYERHELHVAHLARAVAIGQLDRPSGDLADYLLFDDQPVLSEVEQNRLEQQRVVEMLDLIL